MRYATSAAFLVLLAGLPALAQPGTGGSISHLNASLTQGDSPVSGLGAGPSTNFTVGGAGNPDHLGSSWWWTRTSQNNTRELANNNAIGPSWSGRVGQLSFNDGNSGLSITRTYLLTGLGEGRGTLEEGASITNISGASLTVDLFHFLDPTLGGAAGGISAAINGVNSSIRITSGTWTAFYEGSGQPFQAGAAGNVLGMLTDGDADNFSNQGLPFGPGDFEAGFQWRFILGPGETAAASMTFAVVPTPGSLGLLLAAGGLLGARRRTR